MRRRLLVPMAAGCVAAMAAMAACAPAHPAGEPARPHSLLLVRLLSDAVLVLPVHEASISGRQAIVLDDPDGLLRARFDSALQRAFAPYVTGAWSWAPELRALYRRNPLHVPDPTRLPTTTLRGARLAADQQLPADLGSGIRALLAVAGSRRYVVLPLRLHYGPTSRGGYAAGVTLVIIDARQSAILDIVPVHLGRVPVERDPQAIPAPEVLPPPETIFEQLAGLARLQFTGPDDN